MPIRRRRLTRTFLLFLLAFSPPPRLPFVKSSCDDGTVHFMNTIARLAYIAGFALLLNHCVTAPFRCPCTASLRQIPVEAGSPPRQGPAPARALDLTSLTDRFSCACSRRLTDAGKTVLPLNKADVTADCQALVEVNTGFFEPERFETAVIMLRNVASEVGANAVAIDTYEPGAASGRALQCSAAFIAARTPANEQNKIEEPPIQVRPGIVIVRPQRVAWQKCSNGQTDLGGFCQGQAAVARWEDALNYCRSLSLDGRTWRLPTFEELSGLIDATQRPDRPKIDPELFPNTRRNVYWTSTFFENQANVVRVVDFDSGAGYAYGLQNQGYVRCIADGL